MRHAERRDRAGSHQLSHADLGWARYGARPWPEALLPSGVACLAEAWPSMPALQHRVQAHRVSGCTQAWASIVSAMWRGLTNDLCGAWPRCICYLSQQRRHGSLLSGIQQYHVLLTACCLLAGVYTGTGNNGLSFAACLSVVVMQSLAGNNNTIVDLAGDPEHSPSAQSQVALRYQVY